jgi:hypothetical protein
MTCEECHLQLGLFLDGELHEPVADEVRKHLAQCPDCTAGLETLRAVAVQLQPNEKTVVPGALWPAIQERLALTPNSTGETVEPGRHTGMPRYFRPSWAIAAVLSLAVGLGFGVFSLTEAKVEAASVNFSLLLDSLDLDPQQAFREFIDTYNAKTGTREQAKRHARQLNFQLPEQLPHGFVLQRVYLLTFGKSPGVAASYQRGDEFLATIFHAPVHPEDFGTHKDYECVIGAHRGHQVNVGSWSLVHLTDTTTCRCILSRLKDELPALLEVVAIGMDTSEAGKDLHPH